MADGVDFNENEAGDHTTQFRFSERQKKTLVEYWEKGMQTCSKNIVNVIGKCVPPLLDAL